MSSLGFLAPFARALLDALGPLRAALTSPTELAAMLREQGWRPPADADWFAPVSAALALTGDVEQVATTLAAVTDGTPSIDELEAALGATSRLFRDLRAVAQPAGALPAPFDRAEFWSSFPADLVESLVATYLERAHPAVFAPLHLLGILDEAEVAPAPDDGARLAYLRTQVRWDRLATVLSDPDALPRDVYGWGTAFDHGKLLSRLERALRALGLLVGRHLPAGEITRHYYPGAPPADLRMLQVTLLRERRAGGSLELGVVVLPIPDSGLFVGPYVHGDASTSFVLDGPWSLQLGGGLEGTGVVGVELRPGAMAPRLDGAATTIDLSMALAVSTPEPLRIIGDADGNRLECTNASFALELAGERTDPELTLRLRTDALRVVVDPSDGDGFLQDIFGDQPQTLQMAAELAWSSKTGLRFSGSAALKLRMPVDQRFGPARVDSIELGLATSGREVRISIGVTGGATAGPVTASVTNLGLALVIAPVQAPAVGTFGDLALSVDFQPPTGAGLALTSVIVSGGGYLDRDPATGRYAGMLTLDARGLALTAMGIVETQLPDGGYSLAAIISAQFQPIQVGLGFTLNGVGGMIGIHRRVDTDAVRAAIRGGGIDDIFFSQNPIAQAARLLGDLARYFPAEHGRYVFGPSVKIGWGTPAVFSGVAALLLELPSPVRLVLLAQLRLGLPSLDKPIVDIRLDALGVLDFDRATLALDASLHDSKLAGYALTGDMALRIGWGDAPQFLLSLGGFHPHFTPPPGFPALRRLALTAGDNPQLRLSAYLALTSNTAQVGAQADLTAHGGGFEIKAHVGFDALFEFVPFHFETEITASAAISWHGHRLMGVDLDFLLSGPHPWHAKGDASFGILWWDVSVGFDTTWGDATPAPLPPPPPISAALKDALDRAEAWSSELAAGEPPWVTLGPPAGPTSTIVVHPFAALVVRERAVPLGYRITQFGNIPLAAPQQFDITGVRAATSPPTTVATTPVTDAFAPGQFTRLSSDQRLAAPSFESFASGVRMADAEIRLGASARSSMDLDTEVVDPLAPPARPPHVLVPPAIAVVGPTVRPTRAPAPPPRTGPRLADLAFVLASIDDLSITAEGAAIAAGSTRYAALRESLAARVAATGRIPRLQIVPRVQVSNHTAHVVVVRQDDRMRNVDFVDTLTGRGMTRAEFVDAIHAGLYPDYYVRSIHGVPTPVSKPNTTPTDNLG